MSGYYEEHLRYAQARRFAAVIGRRMLTAADPPQTLYLGRASDLPHVSRDVYGAMFAVSNDHPELFFLGQTAQVTIRCGIVQVQFQLKYSPADIRSYRARLESVRRREAGRIAAACASPIQREMALYRYLCQFVTYTGDGRPERYDLVGALLEKKAVCAGISKAFTYLAGALGLRAITVMGQGRGEPHAWNIVDVDGTPAHVDATWGAGRMGVDWSYFNLTDEQIRRDHALDLLALPRCDSAARSYYCLCGAQARDERQLVAMIRREMRRGRPQMQFRLEQGNVWDAGRRALQTCPGRYIYCCNSVQNTILLARA